MAFEVYYGVPGLVGASISLTVFGIAALYVTPGPTKTALLILAVASFFYGLGDGLARLAAVGDLDNVAATWNTVRFFGIALVPAALLHFAGAYTGALAFPWFKPALLVIYLATLVFIPLRVFTGLVVSSTTVSGGVIHTTVGPAFVPFGAFGFLCSLASVVLLEGEAREARSALERRHARRCAAAAVLPFGAALVYLGLFRQATSPAFDPIVLTLPVTVALLGGTLIGREVLFPTLTALRAVFAQMPDGLVVIDPKGVSTFANRAASDPLAPSGGGLEGEPFLAALEGGALPALAKESLKAAFQKVAAKESDLEVLSFETAPPGPRSLRAVIAAAEVGGFSERGSGPLKGRDRYLFVSVHDDTEVRAREVLLTRANEVKDLFISMIGHDLKAPINAIMGYSELIGLDSQSAPDALAVFRYSQSIRASAAQIQLMMENARLLSRLADPQDILRAREPLALSQLVEREAANLRGAAERRRVRVDVEVEPSASGVRLVAAPILRSVFQNLIDNAVKYTVEGTVVTVRVSAPPGEVVVTIEDEGPGVPPEKRAAVFERFTRLEQTRTKAEGIGLGLSISKQVVELHGGTLTIEDRRDGKRGALFRARLPLEGAPGAAAGPQRPKEGE